MRGNRERLLTIGQFAVLHHINKKTLMWYDQVGLFKPAVIGENGYRYYTWYQNTRLETILMLREMGVSIQDIRTFLEDRSAETLEALLGETIGELDRTILRPTAVRKKLSVRRADMRTPLATDLSEIRLVEVPEPRWLAEAWTSAEATFEEESARVIAEAGKHQVDRLYDAAYGAMLPVERLYDGQLADYSALFVEIPEPATTEGLHLRPAGTYLRAFCKGPWEKLPQRYREILAYAEAHGLRLWGCAYETGVNELVIDTMDDYITQIEIPVKRI